jgi:FMN phosphatase YigB (HAD superfamily)
MTSQVASFDVFDTIITRKVCDPEGVFLLLGNRVCAHFELGVTPEMFARARVQAERGARLLEPEREPDLAAIHRVLRDSLILDQVTSLAILQEELRIERELSVGVPRVLDLLENAREKGYRIAFLSDMYLGHDQVQAILEENVPLRDDDLLLVSCDVNATKASGSLYQVLKDRLGPDVEIKHYGDNAHSDVQMPRKLRIEADHVTDSKVNRYESILETHRWSSGGLSSVLAGASRTARMDVRATTVHDIALRDVTAGVAAPIFAGFLLWLFDLTVRLDLERLYFVSRDGQVLLGAAKSLRKTLARDTDLRYLYGGRHVWYLAAAPYLPVADAVALLLHEFSGSLRMLLRRLDIDDEEGVRLARRALHQAAWDAPLGADALDFGNEFLSQQGVYEHFLQRCKGRAEILGRYLEQEGVLDGKRSGLVDIGWTGRSAASLATVIRSLGGQAPHNFYVGLRETPPLSVAAYDSYFTMLDTFMPSADVSAFVTMLEAFCSGDQGPLLGFQEQDGTVLPQLGSDVNTIAVSWGLPIIRRTVAAYFQRLHIDPDTVPLSADVRWSLIGVSNELLKRPTRAEVREFGAHSVEREPGGGDQSALALPYRSIDVARYLSRRGLPFRLWPTGSTLVSRRIPRWILLGIPKLRRRLEKFGIEVRRR